MHNKKICVIILIILIITHLYSVAGEKTINIVKIQIDINNVEDENKNLLKNYKSSSTNTVNTVEVWSNFYPVSQGSNDEILELPKVICDPSGGVHIVWLDSSNFGASGSDSDIYYRYKPPNGNWGKIIDISKNDGWSYQPSIACDSKGGVHIVWLDSTNNLLLNCGDDPDIFYRYKSNNGLWGAINVVSKGSNSWIGTNNPKIICDDKDGIHIVWQDNYSNLGGDDIDIFYRYKGSNNILWDNVLLVSSESNKDSYFPSIAYDTSSNTVHVAWSDNTQLINGFNAGNDYDILYSSKNLNDLSFSKNQVISKYSDEKSTESSLTCYNGIIHAAWMEEKLIITNPNRYDINITYKYKSINELDWSRNPEIVTWDCYKQSSSPSLTCDKDGILHISWSDETNLDECGKDNDIFYKTKNNNQWSESEIVSLDSSGYSLGSDITCDSDGIPHIVWIELNPPFSTADLRILYKSKIKTILENEPKLFEIEFPNSLAKYKSIFPSEDKTVYRRGMNSRDVYVKIDESGGNTITSAHKISMVCDNPSFKITDYGWTTIGPIPKKARHFLIDIPDDIAIGRATVTAILSNNEYIIDNQGEYVYIIFNAWNSNTPEYSNNQYVREAFIKDTTSIWWISDADAGTYPLSVGYAMPYMTEHYKNRIFLDYAIKAVDNYFSLNGSEIFHPKDALKRLNEYLHNILSFKIVGTETAYGSFTWMLDNGVVDIYSNKIFAECDSWANALVTLLRSLGIAAHPVTSDDNTVNNPNPAYTIDTALELFYDGDWYTYLGYAKSGPTKRSNFQNVCGWWNQLMIDCVVSANELWADPSCGPVCKARAFDFHTTQEYEYNRYTNVFKLYKWLWPNAKWPTYMSNLYYPPPVYELTNDDDLIINISLDKDVYSIGEILTAEITITNNQDSPISKILNFYINSSDMRNASKSVYGKRTTIYSTEQEINIDPNSEIKVFETFPLPMNISTQITYYVHGSIENIGDTDFFDLKPLFDIELTYPHEIDANQTFPVLLEITNIGYFVIHNFTTNFSIYYGPYKIKSYETIIDVIEVDASESLEWEISFEVSDDYILRFEFSSENAGDDVYFAPIYIWHPYQLLVENEKPKTILNGETFIVYSNLTNTGYKPIYNIRMELVITPEIGLEIVSSPLIIIDLLEPNEMITVEWEINAEQAGTYSWVVTAEDEEEKYQHIDSSVITIKNLQITKLFGIISDIIFEEDYIYFTAENLHYIKFRPITYKNYISGEKFAISKNYIGYIRSGKIRGLFRSAEVTNRLSNST
jgi:hypothetical protein